MPIQFFFIEQLLFAEKILCGLSLPFIMAIAFGIDFAAYVLDVFRRKLKFLGGRN